MSNENKDIEIRCELCGKSRGLFLKIASLPDAIKPNEAGDYLHGMCQECGDELAAGCVFFTDRNRRVMKVGLEASKAKIDPQFHGKVVGVPSTVLDELIRVWAQANLPPPEDTNKKI